MVYFIHAHTCSHTHTHTHNQLISCQKEYGSIADNLRIAAAAERERALLSYQAVESELKQCAFERDTSSAKVLLLSEALEQEKKKYALLESK